MESKTLAQKSFKRDVNNKVIAGVASGMAAYFGIDPVVIRLVWLVAVLMLGVGILPYLILWLIMPANIGLQERARHS